MNNIILIGMPACGKSTIGVILAKTMGMNFLDTDLLIQGDQNALLQEIINSKGNEYFQKVEERVLSSLTASKTVIATGGSAVYYDRSMRHLKELGTIVYLSLPLSSIEERLNNISTRGITMAPGETLSDLYYRRVPLYEKYAQITIDADALSIEQVVEAIIYKLSI